MPNLVSRITRKITPSPMVAVAIAMGLLVASLILAVYNEDIGRDQAIREAEVQASILASSVAAPLAFDDAQAAQEYVNALGVNPVIEAAAAFDSGGRRVAGFSRSGDLPQTNPIRPPTVSGGVLTVTTESIQGSTRLGSVYLQARLESPLLRASRYFGIAAIVIMASLLVAALGSSHALLSAAHRRLQEEIAEREKAEEALRQAQKMEAMGQLTGGVAHDFNNLLMVASSGLDLMDRTTDPTRRERLKDSIRKAIDRGANLTQQLLVFARRTPMKAEVVDLGARLHGMHDLLERSLREHVTVDVSAPSDIWPVEVDPSQFEVAVLNLALNARDAMPGGGAIRIVMEHLAAGGSRTRDEVRVTVADTGIGMPAELLGRVFEPFFTTKGVGEGTGLGLSQVYGFARASGGEVEIESQVGQGTRVSLRLPRSDKALPRRTPSAKASLAVGSSRRRVLLVEDDDSVALLVGEMLQELGYDAQRAATAASALEVLAADPDFDLVFSDMVMPGDMNGLALAHEIARRRPDVPVILTTGYSASAAAATAEGMRVLIKP
ncbi:MAG: ATP-binding protein, partial [Phenylobacterium sp.]|nr:ATP-binding protein [Phenylobacterium sp.]